jgi:hypothetical protein
MDKWKGGSWEVALYPCCTGTLGWWLWEDLRLFVFLVSVPLDFDLGLSSLSPSLCSVMTMTLSLMMIDRMKA